MTRLVVAFALMCGGCVASNGALGSPDAAGADARVAADAAARPADAAAPPRCTGLSVPARDRRLTLTHGGHVRAYWVHVPPDYDPTVGTPVVLNFHGLTSNAAQQQLWSRLFDETDRRQMIAVHPEGLGAQPSWNAGACCGFAADTAVDDVGFVDAMLDALAAELCVDPARVYAMGMSNGGFLSHRLACELSDRVAAITSVTGVLGIDECAPTRPVPVLQIHGTEDTLVPYEGNEQFVSVAATVAGWVERNGCTAGPEETFASGDTRCEAWRGCDAGAEVALCTVEGGGHTWPGGWPIPALGHTTDEISATAAALDFFEQHALVTPGAR
jgi:polyhydroxybutyrate depolymerase